MNIFLGQLVSHVKESAVFLFFSEMYKYLLPDEFSICLNSLWTPWPYIQRQINLHLTCISRSLMTSQKEMLPLIPQPAVSVFTVNWPDFPHECQKLSHWHLTKNTIHWLNKSACSNCTARRHFPTTFWELRSEVISDVIVIAKSPRAELSPNPSFYSQSVRSNRSIKRATYRSTPIT